MVDPYVKEHKIFGMYSSVSMQYTRNVYVLIADERNEGDDSNTKSS